MEPSTTSLRFPVVLKTKGQVMNWDQVEGKWKEFSGHAKKRWGDLTDDEIMKINGSREELEGKNQAKCGKSKEQVRDEVDDWMKSL
jgi:uncharacterized protein YjbJ (UPF0337 family)